MSTNGDNRGPRARRVVRLMLLSLCLLAAVKPAQAQQTIGYIDSEEILGQMPEYETIQGKVDQLAQEWRGELKKREQEVDDMFEEYQARELLYTDEERKQKRESIMQSEQDVEELRAKYFGPEGQLYTRQEELMRPLQERILTAVESVAGREGYDFVFDKAGGEVLFMYADAQYDLSDLVLQELGVDVEQANESR